MAPLKLLAPLLQTRDRDDKDLVCDSTGNNCYYVDDDDWDYDDYSRWDHWGRWVALVLVVFFFLALACLFTSVRRRRQRGLAPMYGTGWIPGAKPYYPPEQTHGGWAAAPPPPMYMGHQATGTTFNSNDGYYGGPHAAHAAGTTGIELQQPQMAHHAPRGADDVYAPPSGPPPGKGDGIIG